MANREKGEVSLTVEGKTYTLVLNTGAMVALEEYYSASEQQMSTVAAKIAGQAAAIQVLKVRLAAKMPVTQGDLDALAARLADVRDATWDEVWARILKGSVKAIRAVIWAMLQKHHPEITLTATQELIDQVGGLDGLQSVLTAAGGDASPDPKDVEALGITPDANPRKAQTRRRRGTGGRSTAMPGASA